ncbi:hypothetical protein IEN85_04930 [Pelagicoccus sp. NFK12]|uniref:DUF4412 domain-containing protein n=1 Tax=Pelagicoccus enzymogenes TaxID=2773457 RepID=A0A927F6D2_9BACT|nr:hypothetical protein [Pelagicoccus enzymogenes]MBD5778825.1 hypothetical protein [Pelagicoccus enzymogenes]
MTKQTCTLVFKRLVLSASILLSSTAFAGYVYQFEDSSGGTENVTLMVEGHQLRITSQDKGSSDMIFDASTSTMTILEHDRKRYLQLDKETVAELASQIEDAMAEMEKQLASLPPAQRKMMENMMKGKMQGMGEALPVLSFNRTGESDTKSGYDVEKVILLKDGVATSELWVADWDDVEGSEELMVSLKAMAGMFKDMMKAFSKGPMAGMIGANASSNWFGQIEDLGGIPIVTAELDASGKAKSQTSLSKVEEREIEASAFEIPKGYKKQKMKM